MHSHILDAVAGWHTEQNEKKKMHTFGIADERKCMAKKKRMVQMKKKMVDIIIHENP